MRDLTRDLIRDLMRDLTRDMTRDQIRDIANGMIKEGVAMTPQGVDPIVQTIEEKNTETGNQDLVPVQEEIETENPKRIATTASINQSILIKKDHGILLGHLVAVPQNALKMQNKKQSHSVLYKAIRKFCRVIL